MYTGITQGLFSIIALSKQPGLMSYTVKLISPHNDNLKLGASVSIDGVCQTVVNINNDEISFEAIQETLDKTTLSDLQIGSQVSIERSRRIGDEIGGHEVSGHVFGT